MARKSYAGGAKGATLNGAMTAASTDAFGISDATGWPTGSGGLPFVVTVDRNRSTEEKILCTSRTGTSITPQTRGYDGTTGVAHAAGATIEHTLDADSLTDFARHVYATDHDDHPQYLMLDKVADATQTVANKVVFSAEVELDGALNHDGSTVGFFGVTPAARPAAYTVTNGTTDRSYDADTVAVAELADIVGTLIADLKTLGILQ